MELSHAIAVTNPQEVLGGGPTLPSQDDLELALDAALGVTASSTVSQWVDQVRSAAFTPDAGRSQTEPTFVASAAGLNGQPAVELDSASDGLACIDGFGGDVLAFTDLSVLIVVDIDSNSTNDHFLRGGAPGSYLNGIVYGTSGSAATNLGVYDGTAHRTFGAATVATGAQALLYIFDAGGSEVSVYRNGSQVGSAQTYDGTFSWQNANAGPTDSRLWFGSFGGGSPGTDGRYGGIWAWSAQVDPAEVAAFTQSRFGV